MSDIRDNSNELENYGDWVKKPPVDIEADLEAEAENMIDDIDLPDFGETGTDLSDDMFRDIDFSASEQDSRNEELSLDDGDTALSPEELANITVNQDFNADSDSADFNPEDAFADEAGLADFSAEETPAAGEITEEVSFDIPEDSILPPEGDFSAEEAAFTEEAPAQASGGTEEIDPDSFGDGEIDMSSFMDDSSSGDGISFEDGDIDLGDFMSDFGGDSSPSKPQAEITDEKTLGIDVTFDDYSQELAAENAAAEKAEAEAAEKAAKEEAERQKLEAAAKAQVQVSSPAPSSEDSDEVDLSEFGFDDDDSNIGMTNGPDENLSPRKEVVDYEMKVSVDDDSKTPPVQDVVNGKVSVTDDSDSEYDISEEGASPAAAAASPEMSERGREILEQIMGELTSLKNEIQNLKSDFAGLNGGVSVPAPAAEEKAEDAGFFGSDDGDDTIALSGTELNNILSSADFSEESASPESAVPQVEESPEPEFEETSVSDDDLTMDFSNNDMEEPTIDRMEISPEDLADTTDEFGEANILPEEISLPKSGDDISVESSSSDLMDSVRNTDTLNDDGVESFMQEDPTIEETLTDEKINYLGEDGAPDVSEIMQDNLSLRDNSDAGISIDSDIETAFEQADAAESTIIGDSLAQKEVSESEDPFGIEEEEISGDNSDIPLTIEEPPLEETVFSDDEEIVFDETAFDDVSVEETVIEEAAVSEPEEPAVEDTVLSEPAVEEPAFEEAVEETSVEEPVLEQTVSEPQTALPKDLKSEVISVLSYMDQLLENLPEDKITEFAKSEHFVTYKKLFDELGLS